MKRTGAILRVLLAAAVLQFAAFAASADEAITDPRLWSDALVKMIAEKRLDAATAQLADSGRKKVPHENIVAFLAPLVPALEAGGENVSVDLMAEQRYGRSVVVFWYYMGFQHVDLFVRIAMIKRGEYWKVLRFGFNDDFEKIGLP